MGPPLIFEVILTFLVLIKTDAHTIHYKRIESHTCPTNIKIILNERTRKKNKEQNTSQTMKRDTIFKIAKHTHGFCLLLLILSAFLNLFAPIELYALVIFVLFWSSISRDKCFFCFFFPFFFLFLFFYFVFDFSTRLTLSNRFETNIEFFLFDASDLFVN